MQLAEDFLSMTFSIVLLFSALVLFLGWGPSTDIVIIIIFISGYQKGHKSPLNWPPKHSKKKTVRTEKIYKSNKKWFKKNIKNIYKNMQLGLNKQLQPHEDGFCTLCPKHSNFFFWLIPEYLALIKLSPVIAHLFSYFTLQRTQDLPHFKRIVALLVCLLRGSSLKPVDIFFPFRLHCTKCSKPTVKGWHVNPAYWTLTTSLTILTLARTVTIL